VQVDFTFIFVFLESRYNDNLYFEYINPKDLL